LREKWDKPRRRFDSVAEVVAELGHKPLEIAAIRRTRRSRARS
jgi:hypothetical protein